jgi:predicted DNA-binding protein (MmcQ/YjbR family)
MAGSRARDGCGEIQQELIDFALGFPEAWVDYPWDFPVVKVRKKIFVFLDEPADSSEYCALLGVKLPETSEVMLLESWAEPMGHNLGKSGWVTMRFRASEDVPLELLFELIEESYCAVAPKRLSAAL